LTAVPISRIGAPNQPIANGGRFGQRAGGTGNGDGALDVIGDMPTWQPQLPQDWGVNRGILQQRNTGIFGDWP
jgi:hypothetical protein